MGETVLDQMSMVILENVEQILRVIDDDDFQIYVSDEYECARFILEDAAQVSQLINALEIVEKKLQTKRR